MRTDEFNGAAAAVGLSARDRLNADLKALGQDANTAVSDLVEATGLGDARLKVSQTASRVRARSEGVILRHPWRSVAVVAGVGLVLGWLLRTR